MCFSLLNNSDLSTPIRNYNKSIEIDPQHIYGYNQLGKIYRELKDYERAIEYLNKCIEIDPTYKSTYIYLMSAYFESGEDQKWREPYLKILEIDPDYVGSFTQGLIENSKKIYQIFRKIQSLFTELAQKFPNNVKYQNYSKLDLSNISKVMPEIVEHFNKIDDVKNFYNNLKRRKIISLIPWDIISKIKEITIKLGVKYNRLKIPEIAEKCGSPQDCVIVVINEMIKDEEIYADYFESTQFVVFDKKANLDESENMHNKFKVWEETTCKNCGMKIKQISQKICEHCGVAFEYPKNVVSQEY